MSQSCQVNMYKLLIWYRRLIRKARELQTSVDFKENECDFCQNLNSSVFVYTTAPNGLFQICLIS